MRRTLKTYAKKGYQVAFAKKSNYQRYKRLLAEEGYEAGMVRSSGPTHEGNYKRNAYYVIPHKKTTRRIVRRTIRRAYNPFGLRI